MGEIEVRDKDGTIVKRPGASVALRINGEPEASGFVDGDEVYVDGKLLYRHGLPPLLSQFHNPGVAVLADHQGGE